MFISSYITKQCILHIDDAEHLTGFGMEIVTGATLTEILIIVVKKTQLKNSFFSTLNTCHWVKQNPKAFTHAFRRVSWL